MTRIAILLAIPCVFSGDPAAWGQRQIDFPNHHLHNFQVSERTCEHAVAMGYRLVPFSNNIDRVHHPEFQQLGMIHNTNAHICPLRIHQRKADGKLFVTYHHHTGVTREGLHPVALANGLRRKVSAGSPMPMDADDLEILKGFGAARQDVTDLTIDTVSYEAIQQRFHTSWPLENQMFKSCNVLCNWQSRKVVQDMLQAILENTDWRRYDALFFDSLSGGAQKTTNAQFGGQGAYASGPDGKLAFVKSVVEFVRDPSKTGRAQPYFVFTNIYDPLGKTLAKNWYGSGQLRLDHYYFEKGCKEEGSYLTQHGFVLGTQHANGVEPGTTQAAFVNADDPLQAQAMAYLPANRVALDDAYAWSMRVSRKPNFDHAGFFDQHLDACGTAGIQGSWFGWYGEDSVTTRDTAGQLIYTNACQLLRAIPNWDNVRGVPVPAFRNYGPADQRSWDGKVYRSTNSYASRDVIYSRNPDNHELYVVFRSPDASLQLRQGEKPLAAHFVNPWFSKTGEDALPALTFDAQQCTVTLGDAGRRDHGVRIIVEQKAE